MATNNPNLRDANGRVNQAREMLLQVPAAHEMMRESEMMMLAESIRKAQRELEQALLRIRQFTTEEGYDA